MKTETTGIKVEGTHRWEADKNALQADSDAKVKTCHISCEGQNTVHVTASVSTRTRWEKRSLVEYEHREVIVEVDGNQMGLAQTGFESDDAVEDNYCEIIKVVQQQMELNMNAPVAVRRLLSSIADSSGDWSKKG